jgi:hypothetical protein
MEKDGKLVAGPFSSRDDCLKLFNPISAEGPNAHASAHASVWPETQSSVDDCPDQKADGQMIKSKKQWQRQELNQSTFLR